MVVNNLRSTLSTGGMRTTAIGMVVPNGRPRYVKGISPTKRQKGKLAPSSIIDKPVNSPPLFLPLRWSMGERAISVSSLWLVRFGFYSSRVWCLGWWWCFLFEFVFQAPIILKVCSYPHSQRISDVDSWCFLGAAKLGSLFMCVRRWDLVSFASDLFNGSMRKLRIQDIGT